ncbi:MAG TPA: EVE domain-containing protein [Pyrinomonadaceae bacterium]
MKYWMVKQEPAAYSFDQLLKDKTTDWTGIRNFQARNNLREMRVGDKVLFYHSVSEKAVVGLAEVSREAFTDATDEEGKWIAVEIKAVRKFEKPVTLDEIKRNPDLQNIALIKQSRLSVIPLSEIEFNTIIELTEK